MNKITIDDGHGSYHYFEEDSYYLESHGNYGVRVIDGGPEGLHQRVIAIFPSIAWAEIRDV